MFCASPFIRRDLSSFSVADASPCRIRSPRHDLTLGITMQQRGGIASRNAYY